MTTPGLNQLDRDTRGQDKAAGRASLARLALVVAIVVAITAGPATGAAEVLLAGAGFISTAASYARSAVAWQVALAQLPANLSIPPALPAGIQDPVLLEAWVRLYNNADAIPLWDGRSLSGRELAQFALDQAIPIVWDTGRVCGGGNCSIRYCSHGVCTFGGPRSAEPIYIAPVAHPHGDDMQFLVGTLAHEIFHRTSPFGPVSDTKFEEYWAFRIGAAIGRNAQPDFHDIDPLVSGELFIWLLQNKLTFYYTLPEYPASAAVLVQNHLPGSAAPAPRQLRATARSERGHSALASGWQWDWERGI